MSKKIYRPVKIGVIGIGRGISFASTASLFGMKLVAICDRWKEKLTQMEKHLGVSTYSDYDKFLEHEMDAVILANNFHEHAPFAIKALKAGCHVMSETAACHTLAEGVTLARAVEKSGKIYMLAENYPYSANNQEMARLYREGVIGDFKYGEGEYIHPMHAWNSMWISPGFDHWRNWIPATYYCTHSMAPVMCITGTRPVKVNGFVIPYDFKDPNKTITVSRADTASIIICRMDNDALVKLIQGGLRGHGSWVRIHGNKGLMETCRTTGKLKLILEPPFDKKIIKLYKPDFPFLSRLAKKTGHGGGDVFMDYLFAEALRSNRQPFLDVYRAIDMSIIGILAYKSALNDSAAVPVPDFRDEKNRKQYENDHWSPDPARRKQGQPWPSMLGDIRPARKAIRYSETVWRERGKHWRGEPWTKYDIDGSVMGAFTPDYMRKIVKGQTMQYK